MNKMNNKGQMAIGGFILLFIGIIVAVSLIQPSAQNIGTVINTENVVNASVTFPTNTTALVLTGQAVSNVVVINASDVSKTVPATNYTIANYGLSSSGTLQATIVAVGPSAYQGKTVNISYTDEPLGYAKEQSSRSVTSLIIVLAALAILAFVLYWAMKEGADAFS